MRAKVFSRRATMAGFLTALSSVSAAQQVQEMTAEVGFGLGSKAVVGKPNLGRHQ
jgi:hypothetical protein